MKNDLSATDREGLARWASVVLGGRQPPRELAEIARVTILDLVEIDKPRERALIFWDHYAEDMLVTVPLDANRREVFAPIKSVYDHLILQGFDSVSLEIPEDRPNGLRAIDRDLFLEEAHPPPRSEDATGVTIEGVPRGEEETSRVAERVRAKLDDGENADDLLVLFRNWDEHAGATVERLRQWGVPVRAIGARRPLGADATIAALLAAVGLPLDDWDVDALIRLLRGGHVRLGIDPLDLAHAAAALRETRVFRGLSAIRDGLERLADGRRAIPTNAKPASASVSPAAPGSPCRSSIVWKLFMIGSFSRRHGANRSIGSAHSRVRSASTNRQTTIHSNISSTRLMNKEMCGNARSGRDGRGLGKNSRAICAD